MIGGASHQREQGEGRDRREEHRAPPKGDAMQAGRRAGKPPGGTVPVSELGWDGIGRWHVSAEPSKPWFVWPGRRRRSGSHRRPRPIIVRQRQQQRIGGSGATSLWSHGGRVEDDGGADEKASLNQKPGSASGSNVEVPASRRPPALVAAPARGRVRSRRRRLDETLNGHRAGGDASQDETTGGGCDESG
ncbi:hypothetical protein PCL_09096 [Purpureocillium lilacinum]|uniref:Uncharacterized protein n=1 Tax=Purpureocillium lilacinum TaxID=33203 RepID=A0A2U3EHA5_PURLI|nr:hypothetical protein PCL_09096 [Purpureocillium lilacinum]